VQSSDTVWVFENPDAPIITDISATSFCDGEMLVLFSSYDEDNQWFKDGTELLNETDSELEVTEPGLYSVVYTDLNGCSAVSEEVNIEFFDIPEEPEYFNENNLLSLLETINYPGNYTFQWYQNNEILIGETDIFYCTMEDGEYTLEVTDSETGCINIYTENIVYNAEVACFVSTDDLAKNWNLQVFPNPVMDVMNISFDSPFSEDINLTVYDLLGRRQYFEVFDQHGYSSFKTEINLNDLISGLYLLEIKTGEQRVTHKFAKK